MKAYAVRVWLGALSVWTAACSDNPAAAVTPTTSQVGVYTLRSVAGHDLPVRVVTSVVGTQVDLVSQALTLRPDSTYLAVSTLREATTGGVAGVRTVETTGRYRSIADSVVLTDAAGVSASLQFSDGGVSLRGAGLPSALGTDVLQLHVYRR